MINCSLPPPSKTSNLRVRGAQSLAVALRELVSTFPHFTFLNRAALVDIERVKRPKNEVKLLICPFEHCLKEF